MQAPWSVDHNAGAGARKGLTPERKFLPALAGQRALAGVVR